MRRVLSVQNMRLSDATTIKNGTSGAELMKRAGDGIFDVLKKRGLLSGTFAILCGSGNNAGDGYVLALLLKENDIPCTVFYFSDRFSEDGKYYFDKCLSKGIDYRKVSSETVTTVSEAIKGYDVYVDCLLGTGFKGTPRNDMANVIDAVNELKNVSKPIIVSADINSGLNGDTGFFERCIKSDLTIAIGDLKPGLLLNCAKDVIGEAVSIDIGIDPVEKTYFLVEEDDVASCLPKRKNMSNKGTYGYIGLIGGSLMYSGAIRLAGSAAKGVEGVYEDAATNAEIINGAAAMRSGAGVVMIAAPKSLCPVIASQVLECTVYPLPERDGTVVFDEDSIGKFLNRLKAVAFGMGIGNTPETEAILKYILKNYHGVLVIDADGLNALSKLDASVLKDAACKEIILTPHIKEFSRLTGMEIKDINEDPIGCAINYAKETGVKLLLKGPTTIVTDGEVVLLVDRGCPGMATAGSGDVLSGIMAAVCAPATDMLGAVASAAYINGLAGELAQEEYGAISMIASDTVKYIPKAIKEINVRKKV